LTSPASKYARLVISAMLAMHRYAPLCRVRWEEVESAHLKSSVAAPSCSAPSPATMHGSYASPCDETSTSSGRQAAWAGTGRTGLERAAARSLRLPGQTSRLLRSVRGLVLTVTSRVKTWSKSITRRPHGAVASLLVNPDTYGLSQKWDFPQLPKHRVGS